jgi:hypothetical protein
MTEPTPSNGRQAEGDMPSEIAKLLDEIRGDVGWREAVAAAQAAASAPPPPARVDEIPAPRVPEVGSSLGDAIVAMREAIRAADEPIEIGARTPLLGDAMAAFRRRLHDEIRISQDRQTAANRATLAALERLAAQVDPANRESALGVLFGAIGELTTVVNDLQRRVAALEARVDRQVPRVDALERANEAATSELEPLGQVRVAIAELEARLRALEGGS